MPGDSAIQWTEKTWNPVTGCTKVSPGCAHCYAETFAERFRATPGHPYEQGFDLRLWPERLDVPLRWTKPAVIFVNSMSDLFHEEIPDEYIQRVFDVMAAASHHTFQVLTKRPDRMRDLRRAWHENHPACDPLPNVWLGTTIENRRFVGRADALRDTPAAVRFISAEPLLGPLIYPAAERSMEDGSYEPCWTDDYRGPELDLTDIGWLIIGGESGPGARRFDESWARDLIITCRDAGTLPFVKQMGAVWARAHGQRGKAGTPEEWPEDLRLRRMPPLRALAGPAQQSLLPRPQQSFEDVCPPART